MRIESAICSFSSAPSCLHGVALAGAGRGVSFAARRRLSGEARIRSDSGYRMRVRERGERRC